MTSATRNTDSSGGQHYWTVELPVPAKASVALRQFIAMAQDAIQTAVDLLGRGAPELPPAVDDLLQTVTYTDLGSGAANSNYRTLLSEIQSRQTSLLSTDEQVLQASATVSAGSDTTLQYIETIVTELQHELRSVTGKLTAAENSALMQQIGAVVDMVNARVTSVYQANQGIAGESGGSGSAAGSGSGTTGSSSSSGSTTGSGSSDGLSSILSMLPMLAMPLMSLGPQLLKDFGKTTQPDGGQNGTAGAPQDTTGQPAGPAQSAAAGPGQANAVPAVSDPPAPGTQQIRPTGPSASQPAADVAPGQSNAVPAVANTATYGKQQNRSQQNQPQADQPRDDTQQDETTADQSLPQA